VAFFFVRRWLFGGALTSYTCHQAELDLAGGRKRETEMQMQIYQMVEGILGVWGDGPRYCYSGLEVYHLLRESGVDVPSYDVSRFESALEFLVTTHLVDSGRSEPRLYSITRKGQKTLREWRAAKAEKVA
jgi:hypothetical protein